MIRPVNAKIDLFAPAGKGLRWHSKSRSGRRRPKRYGPHRIPPWLAGRNVDVRLRAGELLFATRVAARNGECDSQCHDDECNRQQDRFRGHICNSSGAQISLSVAGEPSAVQGAVRRDLPPHRRRFPVCRI